MATTLAVRLCWLLRAKLDEAAEVQRRSCKQDLLVDPCCSAQPEPAQPCQVLHLGKPGLDLAPGSGRSEERRRACQLANPLAHPPRPNGARPCAPSPLCSGVSADRKHNRPDGRGSDWFATGHCSCRGAARARLGTRKDRVPRRRQSYRAQTCRLSGACGRARAPSVQCPAQRARPGTCRCHSFCRRRADPVRCLARPAGVPA